MEKFIYKYLAAMILVIVFACMPWVILLSVGAQSHVLFLFFSASYLVMFVAMVRLTQRGWIR